MGPVANDTRSDLELIDACNRGDSEAFDALYSRYKGWAGSVALRFIRNRDDAMDVVQEAFIYLLGKFPGFELTCQFKTFMYPVVRSRAIDRLRKKGRSVSGQAIIDHDLLVDHTESDPANGAETSRQRLAALMQNLPEAQRESLLLRFVDGLSMEEIAQATDVPAGTVKSRLHHGIKALREDPEVREYFSP